MPFMALDVASNCLQIVTTNDTTAPRMRVPSVAVRGR
jgi:hypothetical protein